jgi:hypothetical protein
MTEIRRITDPTGPVGNIREAIYDLAVAGEEFTFLEIEERLGMPHTRDNVGKIARALSSAMLVGILQSKGRKGVHIPQSREDWVAGKPVKKVSTVVYQGTEKVRKGGTNAQGQA